MRLCVKQKIDETIQQQQQQHKKIGRGEGLTDYIIWAKTNVGLTYRDTWLTLVAFSATHRAGITHDTQRKIRRRRSEGVVVVYRNEHQLRANAYNPLYIYMPSHLPLIGPRARIKRARERRIATAREREAHLARAKRIIRSERPAAKDFPTWLSCWCARRSL